MVLEALAVKPLESAIVLRIYQYLIVLLKLVAAHFLFAQNLKVLMWLMGIRRIQVVMGLFSIKAKLRSLFICQVKRINHIQYRQL